VEGSILEPRVDNPELKANIPGISVKAKAGRTNSQNEGERSETLDYASKETETSLTCFEFLHKALPKRNHEHPWFNRARLSSNIHHLHRFQIQASLRSRSIFLKLHHRDHGKPAP